MQDSMVVWLFGRGLSIGCGLGWDVPEKWRMLPRDQQVTLIKEALPRLMDNPAINTSPIQQFLLHLAAKTNVGWRHLFATSNWDYLLQREILKLGLTTQPPWLANSHVFHINGTVEQLPDNTHRSPLILAEDPANIRNSTAEANNLFNQMIWQRIFVVVGMSFECDSDQFLLAAINRVSDDLPIGESYWVLVNPDRHALNLLEQRIKNALPNAKVLSICKTFDHWIQMNFSGLNEIHVFL